ncbi:MAG: glycosyltransferase family 2 protein [Nitrospinae bacterium]|nr:glycosyltransferase family 2 protein [Nitrospinota bacterium]
MKKTLNLISIVIPVFNNKDGLKATHHELKTVLDAEDYNYEIIFVDDGSSDGSFDEIQKLSEGNPEVVGIKFVRNFGQHPATLAGIKQAKGDILITIDADLQNSPEDIPRLVKKLKEGYQVVSGRRDFGFIPFVKRLRSKIVSMCVNFITGVPLQDSTSTFKAYSREIIQEALHNEHYMKFLPIYVCWIGKRITEIDVKCRERKFGRSQYKFLKLLELFFEWFLLFSSGMKMVILMFGIGGLFILSSLLFLFTSIFGDGNSFSFLYFLITFIGGLIFMVFGVMFERVKQVHISMSSEPIYVIDTVICSGKQ